MRPKRCFIIGRITARQRRNTALRLVSSTASQSSSFMRMARPSRVMPALLTSTCRPPCCLTIASTAASTPAASVTFSRRGIRILPGGDYGFAFTPHCNNARDLEFFVKYLGFTPMEAIRCATLYGGQIMMRGQELGVVKDGALADLLLVDGDPLANLAILRDPKRLLAVMKDGVFAKAPEIAAQRRWERAA